MRDVFGRCAEEYFALASALAAAAAPLALDVHVFSSLADGAWRAEDFDGFRARGVAVHLDGDPRVAWAHFLAADLLVTARSSFSGVAAILRKHTAQCPTLSIALAAAASSGPSLSSQSPGPSIQLSPPHVDYEPPTMAARSAHGQRIDAPARAAVATCAEALAAVAARRASVKGGFAGFAGFAGGEGPVARAMDCPSHLDSHQPGPLCGAAGSYSREARRKHCPGIYGAKS